MSTAAALKVAIDADTKGVEDGIKSVNDKVSNTGGFFQNALSSMLGFAGGEAVIGGVEKAYEFLKDQLGEVIEKGMEGEKVEALLNNALENNKGASGQSVEGLEDLTNHLMQVTTYSDDAIKGVEAIGLQAKVPKGIFAGFTQETLDMATAMGISAPDSAKVLTKALNDPAKAAGLLRRENVQLTDAQQKAIKTDIAHGDSLAAQNVILDAVKDRYGQAAEAAGSTFAGKLEILKNQLDNVQQTIGMALLPILSNLLSAVMPLAVWFGEMLPRALGVVQDMIGRVSDFFGFLGQHMDIVQPILIGVSTAVGVGLVAALGAGAVAAYNMAAGFITAQLAAMPLLGPILLIGVAIAAVVAGAILLYQHFKPFRQLVDNIRAGLGPFISQLEKQLGPILKTIGQDAQKVGGWLKDTLGKALEGLGKIVQAIMPTIHDIGDALEKFWQSISPKLLPALGGLVNILKVLGLVIAAPALAIAGIAILIVTHWKQISDFLMPALKALQALWNAVWPGIQRVLEGVWNVIQGVVQVAWSLISGIINIGLDILSGHWSDIWKDIQNTLSGVWDGIKKIISGVLNIIVGLFQTLLGITAGIVGGILGIIGNLVGGLLGKLGEMKDAAISKIREFISAAISFFSSLPGKVAAYIVDMKDRIISTLQSLPGKLLGIGGDMINGMLNGLKNNAGKIMSWLQGLASQILNNVKSFFGIASPSKEFAKIGGALGDGMVEGLKAANVHKRVTDHLSTLKAGVSASVGVHAAGAYTATPAIANNASGNGTEQTIIIQLDGHVLARAVLKDMPTEVRLRTGRHTV